ncbi:MAG: hypothetical protein LBR79_04695 [Oscillospiraceae bacterium]|nr:hypothetical protein [Oscillospiraceae bacterium]
MAGGIEGISIILRHDQKFERFFGCEPNYLIISFSHHRLAKKRKSFSYLGS